MEAGNRSPIRIPNRSDESDDAPFASLGLGSLAFLSQVPPAHCYINKYTRPLLCISFLKNYPRLPTLSLSLIPGFQPHRHQASEVTSIPVYRLASSAQPVDQPIQPDLILQQLLDYAPRPWPRVVILVGRSVPLN
ncbi:hypothetical protein PGT21_013581 [Puccinia graminis f. sp. tritici]|uniref:Uncharacterized protein n=1 Tax=Puccinia graminis f. sp. tritici TaxID=56615 RepID=A0A5B0R0F7_PUCGR|nr:hypothetical protein PGT21_013581 [Puccinia graminis f. sp. tritici]